METVAPEAAKAIQAGGYIGYLFFAVWAAIQIYNTAHKNQGENSTAAFGQRQTELQLAFTETKLTIVGLRNEVATLKEELKVLREEAEQKEEHCNEAIRQLELKCERLSLQNEWMKNQNNLGGGP